MKEKIVKFIAHSVLFVCEIILMMILIIPILVGGLCEWVYKKDKEAKAKRATV